MNKLITTLKSASTIISYNLDFFKMIGNYIISACLIFYAASLWPVMDELLTLSENSLKEGAISTSVITTLILCSTLFLNFILRLVGMFQYGLAGITAIKISVEITLLLFLISFISQDSVSATIDQPENQAIVLFLLVVFGYLFNPLRLFERTNSNMQISSCAKYVTSYDDSQSRLIAYHECGHLIAYLDALGDKEDKGLNIYTSKDKGCVYTPNSHLLTYEQHVYLCLAGYAAELLYMPSIANNWQSFRQSSDYINAAKLIYAIKGREETLYDEEFDVYMKRTIEILIRNKLLFDRYFEEVLNKKILLSDEIYELKRGIAPQ